MTAGREDPHRAPNRYAMQPSPTLTKRALRLNLPPLVLWGARELMRHPAASLIRGAALGALTLLVAGVLLLSEALDRSAAHWIARGPALVVRRVGNDGFRPIPAAEGVRIAAAVPGVTAVRARIWGTAATNAGLVTVLGDDAWLQTHLGRDPSGRTPDTGEAFSGMGDARAATGARLTVDGAAPLTVRLVGRLAPGLPAPFGDLLLLAPQDARQVLGLGAGEATDLALEVFHPGEAAALMADVRVAFPWPVSVQTQSDVRRAYAAGFGRRSGLVLLMYVPALLALALIVLDTAGLQAGTRRHIGLLKAMGWTTADTVRLQMVKTVLLGLPSLALGAALAATLVWSPWSTWLARVLLGWHDAFPGAAIAPGAALLIGLEIFGFIFLPFLVAGFWPALTSAVANPEDLLRQET
jgi:lipoprotein-releasing system permease protein